MTIFFHYRSLKPTPHKKTVWFYSVQCCTVYDPVFRVRMKCEHATIKETDDCSSLCLPPFTTGWLMTMESPSVGEQNIDWDRRFTPRLLNMEAFPDMTNIAHNWVGQWVVFEQKKRREKKWVFVGLSPSSCHQIDEEEKTEGVYQAGKEGKRQKKWWGAGRFLSIC